MGKQSCNKGFTYLEMLIVLSIVILFFTGGIFTYWNGIKLQYQMNIMRQLLLQAQSEALLNKRKVTVQLKTNSFWIDDIQYTYLSNITCTPYEYHYTALGNISKGGTIQCSFRNKQKKIVLQVGSGQMDVR